MPCVNVFETISWVCQSGLGIQQYSYLTTLLIHIMVRTAAHMKSIITLTHKGQSSSRTLRVSLSTVTKIIKRCNDSASH